MKPHVDDQEREFEHSRLSGAFSRDGETVDVEIYRFAGTQDPWQLTVVQISSGATEWRERFATEQDAYRAFLHAVERGGLASFCAAVSSVVH